MAVNNSLDMKTAKAYLLIVCTAILTNCEMNSKSSARKDSLTLKTNINDYLEKHKLYDISSKPREKIIFEIVNNPYLFNENNFILVFANNKCIWQGNFSQFLMLSQHFLIREKWVNFAVEVLSRVKKKDQIEVFHFQNKDLVYIDSTTRCIYMCFLPSNESTNQVKFFPQKKCF